MTNEEAITTISYLRSEYNCFDEGRERYHALSMAIESLKQTQWIPCSERLPEIGHNILITNRQGYTGEGEYKGHNGYHHVWYQYRWNATLWEDEVLAWTPLPEPWKGEQNVHNKREKTENLP